LRPFPDQTPQQQFGRELLGLKAITGAMKGTRLTSVPLTHTTWADWKQRYPRTLVLSPRTGYARNTPCIGSPQCNIFFGH
jgi:hypothetical protein